MPPSNFQRYFYTSVWLTTGIAIGLFFVVVFCASKKMNIAPSLLWSFAYLVIGALLGFIFSVPKIITDNSITPATAIAAAAIPGLKKKIEDNTNLTQISDWLTKVLIGAGLVQLKEIPKFILHLSKVMAEGIRDTVVPLNTLDSVTIMCVAIVLFFSTWGFISGYLVMKLVLTEQFADQI